MRTIKAILFVFALPLVATKAFMVTSPTTTKPLIVVLKSTTKDSTYGDDLKRLQHEYKVLQERLLCDVVLKHDEADAEVVEAKMIENAIEATKIQEQQQLDVIGEAEHHRVDAQGARNRALKLKRQEGREVDARIVDEMDDAYDDLISYSDFKELEATGQLEAAKTLLGQLQENEKRLQATLETLKHHDDESKMAVQKEEIHTQHRSFLDDVKNAILAHPDIMISLDPHIL